jgi:integrase
MSNVTVRKASLPLSGFDMMRSSGIDFDMDAIKKSIREERIRIAAHSHAMSTIKSYTYFDRMFSSFCEAFDYQYAPASFDTIADFLCVYSKNHSWGTVRNFYSGIRYFQIKMGNPCNYTIDIKHLLMSLRRTNGKPQGRKKPVNTDIIKQICGGLDELGGMKSIRDKALLLDAYGGAFRASELVGQEWHHLNFDHRGVTILIPRSKTDQFSDGQEVSIPRTANPVTCPVVAIEEWRAVLADTYGAAPSGPVFPALRTGEKVTRGVHISKRRLTTDGYRKILKDLCEGAGMDRADVGGHSMRSGHATQAAENGASPFEIAAQGRWKSLMMVLVYVRMGKRFQNNSANHLGL